MMAETRGALPICIEVPLVINAANSVRGFNYLDPELQQSIILFAQAYSRYLNNPNDANHDAFFESLKTVTKGDGIRAKAFKVALKAQEEERKLLGSRLSVGG